MYPTQIYILLQEQNNTWVQMGQVITIPGAQAGWYFPHLSSSGLVLLISAPSEGPTVLTSIFYFDLKEHKWIQTSQE